MNIKARRVKSRLKQIELAMIIGVTQSTISQWESGNTKPTIYNLQKLGNIFRCTVDELIADNPDTENR